MKLRNKKTGEIGEPRIQYQEIYIDTENRMTYCYKTLYGVFDEWEVYEEPVKPYWFINDLDGEPMKCDLNNCGKSNFTKWGEYRKQIGNYFETKEEAEKAVEKLKVWKRLRTNGFRTYDICQSSTGMVIHFDVDWKQKGVMDDLDLLFGGKDESNK